MTKKPKPNQRAETPKGGRKSKTQGISFPPDLHAAMRQRVEALGLNQSLYLQTLVKADLQRRGAGDTTFTVNESGEEYLPRSKISAARPPSDDKIPPSASNHSRASSTPPLFPRLP